jgi:hypothetical protein
VRFGTIDPDHGLRWGSEFEWRRKMIYSLIALLLAFWVVGLFTHIGGGFIHTLLVLAAIVFVYDLLTARV